ncbi:MAG: ABC transporter permease [bacterium]|nr:ABC transporter permease [bacterium]
MEILIKRFFHALLILVGIIIINFSLFFLSPGDLTNLYFSPKVKPAQLESLKQQMGIDKPWFTQFRDWISNFLRGDLGYSWAKHRSVSSILGEAIPATLQLTIFALLINLVVGCLIGIIGGINSDRLSGKFIDFVTLGMYSIPVFLLALFFIYFFSLKLQLLPPSGMNSFMASSGNFWQKFWDRLQHLILPVSVLGIIGAAATSRYVHGHMKEILKQDYIRLAIAKGLTKKRIYFNHAFKNAMLPVVTLLGIYFPFLLGSALIVEVIFAWPGIGRVTYEAVFSKDYPVIMAVNLIAGIMVIVGNFISDLLYQLIDPRIRVK